MTATLKVPPAGIPVCVAQALLPLAGRIDELDTQIDALDKQLAAAANAHPEARRLMTIPGIGPQTAHALVATLGPDGIAQFASPRALSAFLGLTPRQNSSGGKTKLGRISKLGNQPATPGRRQDRTRYNINVQSHLTRSAVQTRP